MKTLPKEQIQSTAQVLLAFLDSKGANVPGDMLEGVVSGKSLLRGLLQGTLVVCQAGPAEAVVIDKPVKEEKLILDLENPDDDSPEEESDKDA